MSPQIIFSVVVCRARLGDQAEHLAGRHLKGQAVCGYELARLAGAGRTPCDIYEQIMVSPRFSLCSASGQQLSIDRRIFWPDCSRRPEALNPSWKHFLSFVTATILTISGRGGAYA